MLNVVWRVLTWWWMIRRPVTVGVRVLVHDGEGSVLLVRHSYGPRLWTFPGGGPRRDEPLVATAVRETGEEVGIDLQGTDVRLRSVHLLQTHGKSDHVAVFVAGPVTGAVSPRSREIAAASWFPAKDLPPATSRGAAARIREWIEDRPPATRW